MATYADRVQETTSTTGTGTMTLAGPVTQFQSFSAGIGTGNTCDYCIVSGDGTNWETGNGTLTVSGPTSTLTRATVFASSNSGAKISLSGTSTVFCTWPAQRIPTTNTGLYSGVINAAVPTSTSTGLTTWGNQGGATVTETAAGILIDAPTNSNNDIWRIRYKAVPSTPYSFTALVAVTGNGNYAAAGIGWFDGTKIQTVRAISRQDAGNFRLEVTHVPQLTTGTGIAADYTSSASQPNPVWLKIRDDGTNIHFAWAADGVNFLDIYSVAKSSGYLGSSGYSNVLFGSNAYNSETLATLMWWAQGTT